jgi:predicted ABC-type sugar transport system permease subunit
MHTIYAIFAVSSLVFGGLGLLVACAHLLAGRPRLGETFDAVALVVVGVVFWALASTVGH